MVSQEQANYSINICLHVLILFSFLTIFFFLIISKKEKQSIDRVFDNIINEKVGSLFDNVDNIDKQTNSFTIDWSQVNKVAGKISQKSQGEDPELIENNKKLRNMSIVMVGTLVVILVLLYLYYIFVKKYKINLGHILAENAVIFLFIGAIEYMFFMNIAAKYVPETPEDISNSLLDKIKERTTEYILNKEKKK